MVWLRAINVFSLADSNSDRIDLFTSWDYFYSSFGFSPILISTHQKAKRIFANYNSVFGLSSTLDRKTVHCPVLHSEKINHLANPLRYSIRSHNNLDTLISAKCKLKFSTPYLILIQLTSAKKWSLTPIQHFKFNI